MDFPNTIFKNRPSPTVSSNTPSVLSESRGLVTQSRRLPGQRWEINLTGFVLPGDNNAFSAFLFGLEGPTNTFSYPLIGFGKSSASNKTVSVAGNIGDTTVNLNNLDDVNIGEYFKFANHNKVYQVHAVNGNIATIFPYLQSGIMPAESVEFEDVKFRVRLNSNIQSFSANTVRDIVTYNFRMLEAL